MKKVLVLALCALFLVPLKAVDYCASSSWGYAGTSVTGGGNATPTFVTNESELSAALNKKNSVIIITQNITVTNHISSDKSNLTIMALPGKKLISNKQNASNSGILYLKGSNIIIRNIIFEGPGAFDCDGWDNLCLDKATNVWVDHCDFQDGCDGNFDIKGTADNITVTWCRFRYLKTPRPRDAGDTNPDHTDDHRFSNLVGSGSSDKPTDGTYNITYGFCWWDEGCKQRMTRCRNCLIHYLNCYWNSSVADYYIGPEKASCYFEGCTFAGKANSPSKIWNVFNHTTNYCKFVNCTGNLPSDAGSISAPSYTYDQLSAADAKNYVTNSTCGAGATLTVTNSGEVSSSCDGEVPPVDPPVVSDWWNISDDDFKALIGDIKSETTVRDLHIVATSDKAVTIEANSQTQDTIQFTHRLKLNGTGANNSRHLWFDVTGNCTVTIYLMSAKSTEERTLNIATGSFGNIASTLTASTSLAAKTYSYTGSATRIYLYSANSGINIYGIKLAYPSDPTGIDRIENQSAAHKVLRNGQVMIFRDGKTYSILGARID
jgi:pectate lyase